ncbi:MAG: hypothetical protein KatS3mg111_3578 [Pirellulaceae bacterium]|nr:MAG: hypothetical protein KatS3mg111_3578 [Pirellulaceae bacterium]
MIGGEAKVGNGERASHRPRPDADFTSNGYIKGQTMTRLGSKRWNWATVAVWLAASWLSFSNIAEAQQPSGRLTSDQIEFFEKRIRPVLVTHCYDCHAADSGEPAGGLLLDSADGLRRGGRSGPAIVPGRPSSSLLLIAIKQSDPHLMMPPPDYGEKLPDSVVRDVEVWIRMGAPDPRVSSSVRSQRDGWHDGDDARKDWWAWQPPQPVAVPQVDGSWAVTDIDRFIVDALSEKGLTPNPQADRVVLVRRLSFDLTGLPPRVEDLQRFALARHPEPLQEYVEQLLASPQYGEHFGRHWLDVARYAESTGKDVNVTYPHAWRYRDYVIDSFNADKPFDRFIREQIAGDLLHATSREERIGNQIATGFLAVGPKSINEANARQFAVDVADEQIDAISQAFLGVTIACARCHDHKFDPVTQRDYTALAGILLSTRNLFGTSGGVRGRNRTELIRLPDDYLAEVDQARVVTPDRLQAMQEELQELRQRQLDLVARRRRGEEVGQQAVFIAQRIATLTLLLTQYDEQGNPIPMAMGVADKEPPATTVPRRLRDTLSQRFGGSRRPPAAVGDGAPLRASLPPAIARRIGRAGTSDFDETIRDVPLLIRGELDKPGEIVPRGLPEFLSQGYVARIPEDQSGRLQLAAWIANERNPLTARVIVNRVWSWMFGEGIVATEDNFGTSGEEPANQALLDYLAQRFVADGWSIKKLVREIALSSTYQQSSQFRAEAFEIDPQNRLLWRANVRPLPAEALRDGILLVSGQLQWHRPSGSLIAQTGDGLIGARRVGIDEETLATFDPLYRSVYLPVPRNALPDMLALFDFADNSAVRGDRELTIVPSQALYWMNSQQIEERCRRIAENLWRSHSTVDASPEASSETTAAKEGGVNPVGWAADRSDTSIDTMFAELTMAILSRPPLPEESAATRAFLQEHRRQGKSVLTGWTSVVRALFSSADYRFLQ